MTKKKKRNRYTEQFKAEALRAVETRGNRTVAEVASGLGITEALLHAWKSRARSEAAPNDRGETVEQENRRLRRELADVKKDRDVLVKSIAVFVKERHAGSRKPPTRSTTWVLRRTCSTKSS